MKLEVHIDQLHRWGGRLSDAGDDLTATAHGLPVLSAPPGWAVTGALARWESLLSDVLRSLGEEIDHTGGAVRTCADNYAAADRRVAA
jgi:hypothetical protein